MNSATKFFVLIVSILNMFNFLSPTPDDMLFLNVFLEIPPLLAFIHQLQMLISIGLGYVH
jgi:uncharacterized protein YhhL (DUF1145 family)